MFAVDEACGERNKPHNSDTYKLVRYSDFGLRLRTMNRLFEHSLIVVQ